MNLRQLSEIVAPAVARELQCADALSAEGHYTECSVRLGRAVEAALYAAARECGIGLTETAIKDLRDLSESIRSTMVLVMRRRTIEEVRNLSNAAKKLSETIASLAERPDLREGTPGLQVRANEQILRDLLSQLPDTSIRRRLQREVAILRVIQDSRNKAAHASVSGETQEMSEPDVGVLRQRVDSFVNAILDLIVGQRAEQEFGRGSPAIPVESGPRVTT